MTWMSGKEFCKTEYVRCFVNSTRVVTDADKVVFTHDMEGDIKEWLRSENFKIVEVDPKDVTNPAKDRFLYYWRYLVNSTYDLAMHVDSKDVIFQKNPFGWLSRNRWEDVALGTEAKAYPINSVVLINEGMPPSSNGFHLIEQLNFQSTIPDNFKQDCREVVLNSGVILGNAYEMGNHMFTQWISGTVGSPNCTDQANLNYLYCYLKENPVYHISNPHKESLCLTGEAVKDGYIDTEQRDGIYYRKDSADPYCIFHQWDRTEYANNIIERYSK